MFIHGFDGSWFSHPFWLTRFVLSKDKDLERVRTSAVQAVVIDEARGISPARPVASNLGEAASASVRPAWAAGAPAIVSKKTQNFGSDYAKATRLFGKSKRAVGALYADVRLGKAVKGEKLAPLVDEITASIDNNPRAFISIAQLKSRHEYTYMHSVAVCALMINLARELRFGPAAVKDAGMAGLLHDIGKAVMPGHILDKPGALTDEEYAIMRTHPVAGRDLLMRSSGVSHQAIDVCLRHHERYDGTGYPDGLAGERLSLFARMGALCDVYDAVTSERAYKLPWTPTETVSQMRSWTGHFDPEMFETFVRSVGIYPTGALVRLKSGRIAMVTGENADDPTRPPMISIGEASAERIDPASDEIISMENADAVETDNWETKRSQLVRRFRA